MIFQGQRTTNGDVLGAAVLLSGFALLSLLLITERGETKPEVRVHTAIVTCECPDDDPVCAPLGVDSSFDQAQAVIDACDPDNSTCAHCLAAIATELQTTRATTVISNDMLGNTFTITTLLGSDG